VRRSVPFLPRGAAEQQPRVVKEQVAAEKCGGAEKSCVCAAAAGAFRINLIRTDGRTKKKKKAEA